MRIKTIPYNTNNRWDWEHVSATTREGSIQHPGVSPASQPNMDKHPPFAIPLGPGSKKRSKNVYKAAILSLSQHGMASPQINIDLSLLTWPDFYPPWVTQQRPKCVFVSQDQRELRKQCVILHGDHRKVEKRLVILYCEKNVPMATTFSKKKTAHIQAKGESFTALQPTCSSNTTSATSKLGCWAWGPALKWKAQGGLSHVRILVTSHYWDGFGYGPSHDSESGSQISDATKTTHLPLESRGYDFWRKSLKQKLHQVWELHSNPGLPNKNRARCSKKIRGKSAPTNFKKKH